MQNMEDKQLSTGITEWTNISKILKKTKNMSNNTNYLLLNVDNNKHARDFKQSQKSGQTFMVFATDLTM